MPFNARKHEIVVDSVFYRFLLGLPKSKGFSVFRAAPFLIP